MRVMRSRERERGSDREGESDHGAGATIIHISCAAEAVAASSATTSIYSENEAGKDSVAAAHDDERERAVVAPSPSPDSPYRSFVLQSVRSLRPAATPTSPTIEPEKSLGGVTVLGALPLSQHIGAAIIWAMYYVHWKRSLQLQLYLRSNIIRLSRRST